MPDAREDEVLDHAPTGSAGDGKAEARSAGFDGGPDCGLAARLHAQLAGRIARGSLRGGERLPSEGRLCAEFGVSRPVVREAISRLHADGLVTTRRGSGTFVSSQPLSRPIRLGPIVTVSDLVAAFELRIAAETEAASLAARRREDGALSLLEDLNETCAREDEEGVRADMRFHLEIARASQSRWLEDVVKTLLPQIATGIGALPVAARSLGRQARDAVRREHGAILGAIRSGDESQARAAARGHLENARLRILDGSVKR